MLPMQHRPDESCWGRIWRGGRKKLSTTSRIRTERGMSPVIFGSLSKCFIEICHRRISWRIINQLVEDFMTRFSDSYLSLKKNVVQFAVGVLKAYFTRAVNAERLLRLGRKQWVDVGDLEGDLSVNYELVKKVCVLIHFFGHSV